MLHIKFFGDIVMKKCFKSLFLVLLCAVLCISLFSGCSGRDKKLDIIYPWSGDVNSFDPQVAGTQDEFLIAENCYEGLVRLQDDGTVKPGIAADWTISADGRTYTFHLRQGMKWHISDEVKEIMGEQWNPDITANDFVFALRRAVKPETQCPLYASLSNITGAAKINNGKKKVASLGVKAQDDYTLVIQLDAADDGFFSTLSSCVAMPCNEEFFNATKGRYGLGTKYALFNGQFYVDSVLESSYVLDKNESYTGTNPTQVDNITLNIKNENSKIVENLISGYYDAAFITGAEYEQIDEKEGITATAYSNITWSLLINASGGNLSESQLRQAICLGISDVDVSASKYLTDATGIAPPSCQLGGTPITTAQQDISLHHNAEDAKKLWKQGLAVTGASAVSLTVITTEEMDDYAKKLVQGLQSSIGTVTSYGNGTSVSFSLKIETMTQAEMDERIAADTYDIALYPLEAAAQSPVSFLSQIIFNNYTNIHSTAVDAALAKAKNADADNVLRACLNCEKALISTYTVMPVFYESSYYAMAKGVSDVQFHPGSGRVSFIDAKREK